MGLLDIVTVATAADIAAALSVRRRVFIEEQGVSEAEEIDGYDADPPTVTGAVHVLGRLDGVPVATGRLLLDYPPDENAHVGRVAVLAEHRDKGLGREIMLALHDRARERRLPGITLGAQVHAIGFYEKLGYVARGDVFLDAGIDHRWMDLKLR